jgi:hypothetical protein
MSDNLIPPKTTKPPEGTEYLVEQTAYAADQVSELPVEAPGALAELIDEVATAASNVADAIASIDL